MEDEARRKNPPGVKVLWQDLDTSEAKLAGYLAMANVQELRNYVSKPEINDLLHAFNWFRNQKKIGLPKANVSVPQRASLFSQVDQPKFLKLINEKSEIPFTNQDIRPAEIVYAAYIVTLVRLIQLSPDYIFPDSKDKVNVAGLKP